MDLAAGARVGKYELANKLGEGGFGAVFVARDTSLDRDVAMKFLRPEHTQNPQVLQRFLQEARSAAKVVHPGIVTIFECGQVTGTDTALDGTAFIVMELLHGEALSSRLANARRLDAGSALEIARQIASALEAAHAAGIVHRDLKPDNVYLVRDPLMPGGERVKVLDFGIAKLAQREASRSSVQTASMMVFGTPRYMAPEQCRSAAHADARSDIYALGCILFELVTGAPPFDGELGELIAKHQMVPPPTARSVAPDVPPSVDAVIARMLAKPAGERPQTMTEVQHALAACAADGMSRGSAPTLGAFGASSSSIARAGTMPTGAPAFAPTTLSSATGATSPPHPPRRRGVVAGIAAAAAVGIAVLAFALSRGDSSGADVPAPAAAPAPATATPTAATPAAATPAAATPTAAAPTTAAPTATGSAAPSAGSASAAKPGVAVVAASRPATTGGAAHAVDVRPHGPATAGHAAAIANAGSAAARPAGAGSAQTPAASPPCAPVKDGFVDPFHSTPCAR